MQFNWPHRVAPLLLLPLLPLLPLPLLLLPAPLLLPPLPPELLPPLLLLPPPWEVVGVLLPHDEAIAAPRPTPKAATRRPRTFLMQQTVASYGPTVVSSRRRAFPR